MNSILRMQYLLEKYFNGTASREENDELVNLIETVDDETLSSLLKDFWAQPMKSELILNDERTEGILTEILKSRPGNVPVVSIIKRTWFQIAAAVILLMVVTGTFLLLNRSTRQPINEINQVVEIAKTTVKEKPLYKNDIKPGGNKAILTLADGTKIVLDDKSDGALTRQGNTTVIKLDDGRLAYNPQTVAKVPSEAILYNTLSTPRGGQYNVTLPDGTVVWLNASTSLKFPVSFTGNERRVEVIGEAYFEVAKNESMPFKVKAGNEVIKVLGTHFNVSAYSDDKIIKTTLLEGKVEVLLTNTKETEIAGNTFTLLPGQQSQLDENNTLNIVDADLNEAVAWKNGYFTFIDEDIESIMSKISRWYDIKVVFEEDSKNQSFTGNISRKKNVSEVLGMLEQTEAVHFKIEGKTITIMP